MSFYLFHPSVVLFCHTIQGECLKRDKNITMNKKILRAEGFMFWDWHALSPTLFQDTDSDEETNTSRWKASQWKSQEIRKTSTCVWIPGSGLRHKCRNGQKARPAKMCEFWHGYQKKRYPGASEGLSLWPHPLRVCTVGHCLLCHQGQWRILFSQ